MDVDVIVAAFQDELSKIAAANLEKQAKELTEQAREHIKSKNFAVSAKASNTGKPAYPIPDKQHAISALGFAKMHGDPKDLAEVKKDVAAKFPGLEEKKAGALSTLRSAAQPVLHNLHANEGLHEVAGLGALAVPGLDTLQAKARARMAGDKTPEGVEKRQLLGEGAHAALDVGGLGYLAAPIVAKKALGGGWGGA